MLVQNSSAASSRPQLELHAPQHHAPRRGKQIARAL
jgi:hypothetical protein